MDTKTYSNKPISILFMNGYKVTGKVDVMNDYDDEEMEWSTDISFITNNAPNFGKLYVKHDELKVEKMTDQELKWILDKYNDVGERGRTTLIAAHPSYQNKYFIMLGKSTFTKDFGKINNLLYAATGKVKNFNTLSTELVTFFNKAFVNSTWEIMKSPYDGYSIKGNK